MMKNTIIGIIIGVCVAVTGFHIWFLYSLANRTANLENIVNQVVNVLNTAQQQVQNNTK